MQTFVIAEIGVNHNGSLDQALKLVEVAAAAGAHAAKFQTFKAETLTVAGTATVAYQKRSGSSDQFAMLKALELDPDHHASIARRCEELGIEFMSTAFDSASLDMLCEVGIRRIKIPSGEITNMPFLRDCARRGLPLILSTGMADMAEVQAAVTVIREAAAPLQPGVSGPPLVVLHCTSAYPTPLADANLAAIGTMARATGLPIGFSDHTEGIFAAPLAVALGAVMVEKHVTLDRTLPGPDHAASIEPHELHALIENIRAAEDALGDGVKQARPVELEARSLVRRGLKAARDLPAGAILAPEDIAILRPNTGLEPGRLSDAIGARTTRMIKLGDPIEAGDFVP